MRVTIDGRLAAGVSAKDVILALIALIGAGGGVGHAIEYAGSTVRAMSMDERMTVCNMSIEAGARSGVVAPDATTFDYLRGRPFAPRAAQWAAALADWASLPTDPVAAFDREVSLSAASIAPMVTWGTSPQDAAPITGRVPDPGGLDAARRESQQRALAYMGLTPGTPLTEVTVDRVFIGSCTNSRLEDLRAAARVARGRRAVVPALGRAGLRTHPPGGGGRRARPRVHRGGLRVARGGLLDVRGDQRRDGTGGRASGLDLQPQLRGTPGPGRAYASHVARRWRRPPR